MYTGTTPHTFIHMHQMNACCASNTPSAHPHTTVFQAASNTHSIMSTITPAVCTDAVPNCKMWSHPQLLCVPTRPASAPNQAALFCVFCTCYDIIW
jgi:uncharacterized protein (DUF779 family)